MEFPGRHVVVTGGTGALGTAVVSALLERGATVTFRFMKAKQPSISPTGRMSG